MINLNMYIKFNAIFYPRPNCVNIISRLQHIIWSLSVFSNA